MTVFNAILTFEGKLVLVINASYESEAKED